MNTLFSFKPTEIQKLFTDENCNIFFIKRDDLIPFSFGGNKVRIAYEYMQDMKNKKCNCMIGYGNARSNLSRTLANFCKTEEIECHLISPINENEEKLYTFNEKLCETCGAIIHLCSKNCIPETIEYVFNSCKNRGLKPYYINGNKFGVGNEVVPVQAYFRVYKEIEMYQKKSGVSFDYIFLPCGTGMTQAGLLCGVSNSNSLTTIVGISTARAMETEKDILRRFINKFCEKKLLSLVDDSKIIVDDSVNCGGYGRFDVNIEDVIDKIYKKYGIPLDPVYTGKAFWGMLNYIKKNKISRKKILFLHTGGTPLFFDYQRSKKCNTPVCIIKNKSLILQFLTDIDNELPTKLSDRVDLVEFMNKVVSNGKILGIIKDGMLVSAVFFYSNDFQSKVAYITLLGTLKLHQGYGYSGRLMFELEESVKKDGMEKITLHTEKKNTKAICFYLKCGFTIEVLEKKIYLSKDIRDVCRGGGLRGNVA